MYIDTPSLNILRLSSIYTVEYVGIDVLKVFCERNPRNLRALHVDVIWNPEC